MKNIILSIALATLMTITAMAQSLPIGITPGVPGNQTNGLNGAAITNIQDAALSANVPRLTSNQIFSGSNTFISTNLFSTNALSGSFDFLAFGKDPTSVQGGQPLRLSWDFPSLSLYPNDGTGNALNLKVNNIIGATIQATGFNGNGASITSLNASQATSGTLADARLSANVPLLNGNQTFTGSNILPGLRLTSPLTLSYATAGQFLITSVNNGVSNAVIGSGLAWDGHTLSSSGGGVSSITGPSIITWANSTTTPTGTLNNQTSNTFLAGPTSGSAAAPGFRPMTEADIPSSLAPVFNGTNITNITITNLTGLTTNGLTVVYTNVVLGTIYTNNYGYPIIVSGVSFVPTAAVVAGTCAVKMAMTNSGVASNIYASEITVALIGSMSGTSTNAFPTFIITNGGTFAFTDVSTGAGNSAAVTGGQFVYVQQLSIANTFQGGGSGLTNLSANAPGESNIVTYTSGTNIYPDLSGKMRVPINITNNILFTYPTNGPGICEYQVFGLGGTNTFVLLFPTNVISPLQSNMFTGYGTNWGIVISNGWKINFEDKRGVANPNGTNWFVTLAPL